MGAVSIMDSASALARFRRTEGLTFKTPTAVSGYIAQCKLRRAIAAEYSDEMFKQFKQKFEFHNRKRQPAMTRQERVNKFINKLDRLPAETNKRLFAIYEADGIEALVRELSLPIAILMRTSQVITQA